VPAPGQLEEAGKAVGIAGFGGIDQQYHFRGFTRLDRHGEARNPVGMSLDPTGIDPGLNQPAARPIEGLWVSKLMSDVSHGQFSLGRIAWGCRSPALVGWTLLSAARQARPGGLPAIESPAQPRAAESRPYPCLHASYAPARAKVIVLPASGGRWL